MKGYMIEIKLLSVKNKLCFLPVFRKPLLRRGLLSIPAELFSVWDSIVFSDKG